MPATVPRAVVKGSPITPRSVGYSYLPSSVLATPQPIAITAGTPFSPTIPTQSGFPRANPISPVPIIQNGPYTFNTGFSGSGGSLGSPIAVQPTAGPVQRVLNGLFT